jgi:superfamily II DNA or RNA helicase
VRVAPIVHDLIIQDAIRTDWFDRISKAIKELGPQSYGYNSIPGSEMRLAFYKNDVDSFRSQSRLKENEEVRLLDPFDRELFDCFDPVLRQLYLADALPRLINEPSGEKALPEAMRDLIEQQTEFEDNFLAAWLDLAIVSGDFKLLEKLDLVTGQKLREIAGSIAILRGDCKLAMTELQAALGGKKKSRLNSVRHLPSLFYLALLLRDGSATALKQADTMIKAARRSRLACYEEVLDIFESAIAFQLVPTDTADFITDLQTQAIDPLTGLFVGYISGWLLTQDDIGDPVAGLAASASSYRKLGFDWLAAEAMGLAGRGRPEATAAEKLEGASDIHSQLKTKSLIEMLKPEPAWQRALTAIGNLGQSTPAAATVSVEDERVIWEWKADQEYHISMDVFQQKRKGSTWSKGRKVSLARIFQEVGHDKFKFLTAEDRRLIRALDLTGERNAYGYEETICEFDTLRAARAMVGHPRIVAPNDRENPYEFVEQSPKLVVTETKNSRIEIKLDPQPNSRFEASLCKTMDGPRRVVFTFFSEQHLKLNAILGGTLEVPKTAAEQVLASLGNIAAMIPVHSEIGEAVTKKGRKKTSSDDNSDKIVQVEKVEANPQTHVYLLPHQEGLRIEFFVQPFGQEGPFCRVGEGATNLIANIDGKPLSTMRDLKLEKRVLNEALETCPEISARLSHETSIALPSPLDALEALVELEDLVAKKTIFMHWPKGRSLNLAGSASTAQFNIQIRKDRDWFAASGNLKIDKSLSLDLMQLIEMVGARPGRFIQLDDGRFVALTDQLRKRIDEIAAYGNRTGKDSLRFPKVHAPVLEELCESANLKADKHWTDWVQRMRDAATVCPEVPTTLQTELRDYQIEGYQWMARLAAWGVGGCLADDMGLGKTIQTIALLLERGCDGPALVVAPTSVAANWLSEIDRFAPTLKARVFGEGDRDAFFSDLGPLDVVICSYGLLHTESERLEAKTWHTLVLDEAQAIKNMATQRSQAAMKLAADFRLILTGTPMENHLGELWNLMEFINPGLLGLHDDFQQRFAVPIEANNCRDTKRRLKKLIQPFLLRRTKSQVLQELPSRTEVTLSVELSREEAAFYEAIRQRAIEKLTDVEDGKSKHLQILAEITRLRRACCHPRLVIDDCEIGGSKLELFSKTIDELIDNNHKVLVFSQFVDHLTILRECLDAKGVNYQYLDGSTPAKKRKASVDAFQAGDGDVFLISLKAGGLGLNLTAADYVIHMDPWWNPAVEDQASDRAHRMGQQRPVTIYRLITTGTIEERITALHASKRDLADSLLEGAEISAKLSAEDLLKMIRS